MDIYVDDTRPEPSRRHLVLAGDLSGCPRTQAGAQRADFAREMIEQAFAPLDPCEAQHQMPVEDFAALLSELKPRFMHRPEVKQIVRDLLVESGCDLEKTYFDVPRMRTMTHGDYLRPGIALAVPPHRDTWFGGTESQLNWWLPVLGVRAENTMVFHPQYFDQPVANTSCGYDHDAWRQKSRVEAARHIKNDPREYPRCTGEVDTSGDQRILCGAGGVLLFSACHLHSTSPNESGITRFSVDFRTVDLDDVVAGRGAPNVDNEATGSTLAEYLCAADLSPLPAEIAERYRRATPTTVA